MRPFQCPVYLSCIIIQSTSIPLAYHLFIILALKIRPNSIFSIFSSPEPKAHKVSLKYTNGPSSVRRRRRRGPSVVVYTFKLEYL